MWLLPKSSSWERVRCHASCIFSPKFWGVQRDLSTLKMFNKIMQKKKKKCSWFLSGFKSTTKPSLQITLGLSWIQCICGWVYENESVRSAYCVRESSQPAQDLGVLLVLSVPNQRTHLAQPSRWLCQSTHIYFILYIRDCSCSHAVITIHFSVCSQQVDSNCHITLQQKCKY